MTHLLFWALAIAGGTVALFLAGFVGLCIAAEILIRVEEREHRP